MIGLPSGIPKGEPKRAAPRYPPSQTWGDGNSGGLSHVSALIASLPAVSAFRYDGGPPRPR